MTAEQVSGPPRPGASGPGTGDGLNQVRSDLDDVEAALRRLEEGTYGQCEACAGPIGEGLLAALPAARYCLGHQPVAAPAGPSPGRGDYEGDFPLDRVP